MYNYDFKLRSYIFNIIFAGTPTFAAEALNALIDAGHTISLVLTKPDSASGRGSKLLPSAVKTLALQHNIPVFQPKTLRDGNAQLKIKELNADYMVVAAYGIILPQAVLDMPKNGCINIHASLLPRWRGAAPIQRAILANDEVTGITLIQMNAGLDTGDMLYKEEVLINPEDTTSVLHDKLMNVGAESIVKYLSNPDKYAPVVQDDRFACYADKITKEEAVIDWTKDSKTIVRKIKAYNPQPGAYTFLDSIQLRIFDAETGRYGTGLVPGTIVNTGKKLIIATGSGFVEIKELQLAGSKRMDARSFCAGRSNLLDKVLDFK